MWKWLFHKVIKVRERVAVDLGDGDVEKPFLEHLDDLRTMIVRMALTLCITVVGTFFWAKDLIALVRFPLQMAHLEQKIILIPIAPMDAFMVQVNVSMMAGVILSFPLLLYFLLQFILPGLRSTEKKIIFPALGVGVGLFLLGVVFAFFLVAPGTLIFFYECIKDVNPGVSDTQVYSWSVIQYVKFITQFVLIFGACFETPVVVMVLVKMGILTYKVMKTTRSYAIVAIAIVAAVVTPTQDALTLCLLAVPMYALYEICIWLAWWMEKKDRAANPEYYKGLDEDEKAMAAEPAEWDNEEYNPWSTASDDDEEEVTPRKPVSPTVSTEAAPPAPPAAEHPEEPKPGTHPAPEHGDEAKPAPERTTEEAARDDESKNPD